MQLLLIKSQEEAYETDLAVRLHCSYHHLHVSPATAPARVTSRCVKMATVACTRQDWLMCLHDNSFPIATVALGNAERL